MSARKEHVANIIAAIGGWLAFCLAMTVLVGWYLHIEFLIRVLPVYTAMVYNTALGVLGIAVALIFLPTRKKWAVRLCTLVVISVTFLQVVQYGLSVNLHIDEFFHKYDSIVPMQFPGRMALNTAVTLLLIAGAVFFLSFKAHAVVIMSVVIACIGTSIPVVSLFGYVIGLEEAAGWANFSRMSLPTAVGCIILGMSSIGWGVIFSFGHRLQLILLPVTVSFSFLVGMLAIMQAFRTQEFVSTQEKTERLAQALQVSLDAYIREDVEALKRMAERWETLKGYPEALWQEDTRAYLRDLVGVTNIEVFDAQGNNIAYQGQREFIRLPQKVFEKFAQDSLRSDQLVFQYARSQGVLLVWIPLRYNEKFQGVLFSTIDMDVVLHEVFKETLEQGYQLIVLDGNVVIFSLQNHSLILPPFFSE